MSQTGAVSRPVSDLGRDDQVLPFAVEPLDVRGRIVRLGPALDRILGRHAYPDAIARVVGEAIVLTVLLASALKLEGRFQLQTRTDGILDMLIVDFDAPDSIRAVARFDKARLVAEQSAHAIRGALFGRGHLALTIDQGGDMSRYQGIVALEGQTLEEAAHQYFRQSEQIPTLVRLAVAESLKGTSSSWRAGGLLVQFLPNSPERQRQADFDPGDAPEGLIVENFVEDDAWSEAKLLSASVEDHELVDPTLSSERLLYRLFHEHGVKVFTPSAVQDRCRCSAERIEAMLRSFSPQEQRDMIGDNGLIGVTCEFCSVHREFDPTLLDADRPKDGADSRRS
jgi:molecular chaperone Hsp33